MSASSRHSAGLRIGFCARSRIESLPIGAPQAIAQVCPSAPRTALSDPISDARNPTSGTGQKVVGVGKCGSGDTPILSLSRSPTRMRGSPGACLPATAEQERRRHHDMPIQPARVSVDDTASRAHRAAGVAESLLESRSVFAPPSDHATAAMSVFTRLAGARGRRSRSFDPLEDPSWRLGKSDLLRHLSSRPGSRAVWRETCGAAKLSRSTRALSSPRLSPARDVAKVGDWI